MADVPLTISCEDCEFDNTSACQDCVVSFLLERDPRDAIVIEPDEFRAVELLGCAGLLPKLRHRARRAERFATATLHHEAKTSRRLCTEPLVRTR